MTTSFSTFIASPKAPAELFTALILSNRISCTLDSDYNFNTLTHHFGTLELNDRLASFFASLPSPANLEFRPVSSKIEFKLHMGIVLFKWLWNF